MGATYKIVLSFHFDSFLIVSDIFDLIKDMKAVFGAAAARDTPSGTNSLITINVMSRPDGTYSVGVDKLLVNSNSIEEAAYVVMRIISDSFIDNISNSLFVMHAAASAFGDSAVLFAGSSGSGKTSLALAFSRFDGLIGDECAYVDIRTGAACYEAFPFQLKESNHDLSSRFTRTCRLDVFSRAIGKASYYALDSAKMNRRQLMGISTIVFPEFKRAEATFVGKLDSSDYAPFILGSIIGPHQPSATFALFMKMCSEYGIRFLRVTYSNASDGATALYDFLSKGANHEST